MIPQHNLLLFVIIILRYLCVWYIHSGAQSLRGRAGEAGFSGITSVSDAERADRPAAAAGHRQ